MTVKPWLTDAYRRHLKSDEWRNIREDALTRADHRCSRCPATSNLQVHHRTYLRLGHEHPDDLAVLCERCHEVEHYHQGWERRINAIARKRYGDDWQDNGNAEYIRDEIGDWLENQT